MYLAVLLVAIALLCNVIVSAETGIKRAYSVNFNATSNRFDVSSSFDESADAFGYYYTDVGNSNWNYLDAHAQTKAASVAEHMHYMRALGFLEGYSTCSTIKTFWGNFYSAVFGTDLPGAQTLGFLRDNYKWMQKMADENAATDDYWFTVQGALKQINGVFEGFVAGCSSPEAVRAGNHDAQDIFRTLDNPTLEHFLMINAWGDLYQIALKYWEPGRNSRLHGNRRVASAKKKLVQRCSAIVKLLPDLSDVVFGHATWDTFESLGPRIFKHYSFPLMQASGKTGPQYDIYFSSSPAVLSSVDDFFTVSGYSNLGVMETTNSLYNVKLLDLVVPETVLSWTRAITSHQMAKDGADWATQFARYHSGTYTNQWMVLDLNLFTPGSKPGAGFFTVTEEVPGLIHTEDMTASLVSDSYWPSYNVPYFPDIFQQSGYATVCKFDKDECHDTAPRAFIFRDYHNTVVDAASAEKLLSYNNWQKDAASKNDSCNAIACRGDLEPNVASQGAFGALDAKVSTVLQAKSATPKILARNGPTHYDQPVFCWSKLVDEPSYVHNGQPDCYDFPTTTFPPSY
jgi:hypothetical protein